MHKLTSRSKFTNDSIPVSSRYIVGTTWNEQGYSGSSYAAEVTIPTFTVPSPATYMLRDRLVPYPNAKSEVAEDHAVVQ